MKPVYVLLVIYFFLFDACKRDTKKEVETGVTLSLIHILKCQNTKFFSPGNFGNKKVKTISITVADAS